MGMLQMAGQRPEDQRLLLTKATFGTGDPVPCA